MPKPSNANQSDYLRSCLQQGFFEALEHSSIDKLSISEITQRAGVSRMSFYRYYESKEDIVRQYIQDSFQGFMTMIIQEEQKELTETAILFFRYFRPHRKQAELLIKHKLFHLFHETAVESLAKFNQIMEKTPDIPSSHTTYYYHYTSGGIFSVIKRWIEGGMLESDEEMANLIKEIKVAQGKRYLEPL